MKQCFSKLLIASLIGLGLLAACTRSSDDDPTKKIIHAYQQDDAKTLDPANAYDSVSLDVLPSVYQTLYQYDYLNEEYKTIPLLASDQPKVSADRMTITIPLRKDIHFQDDKCFKATNGKGRTLVAQDFIFGLKRLALPSLGSSGWWILENKFAGVDDFKARLAKAANKDEIAKAFNEKIEGIQALDDFTLQLKLLKPYPQLNYILAMTFTAPVAKEAIDAYADEKGNLTDNPIGTGPFKLKKWERGSKIIFERNPNFHNEFYPTKASPRFEKAGFLSESGKKLPLSDELQMHIIKERQPAWLNFLAGKTSIMQIPKDNFSEAIKEGGRLSPELEKRGIKLQTEPATVFYYLAFNVKDAVLGKSKFLRQALSSAISREKWIETFTNGRGVKQVTALPPGIADRPGHAKIKYDFDLAKSKELLAKAGYPEGKGLPVIKFDLRGADSVARQMGEFFTAQAAQVGIKLDPIYNTFPAFLEKAKQGNLQMFYGGWSLDYPDPENVYQLLYGPNKAPGPNDTNYENPEFDKLYIQMASMEAGPARAAVVEKLDDILQEECPWALGFYLSIFELSHPWVKGFRSNELINNKYKYYLIDNEIKKLNQK